MKNIKVIIFIIMISLIGFMPTPVNAKETAKDTVKFSKCVDGDTAKFLLNREEITVRFLAIDTPETKHPTKGVEPYGKEASKYTCNKLKNAQKIEIEYDKNSDKTDKYGRYLAWVWTDDTLLQKELINNGLAKVAYLYNKYSYVEELQNVEEIAKENHLNIWSDESNLEENNNVYTDINNISKKTEETNEEIDKIDLYILIILIIIYLVIHYLRKTRKKGYKLK